MVASRALFLIASALVAAEPDCFEGDLVTCPNSSEQCSGDVCCPDGSVCPSAKAHYVRCGKGREHTCKAQPTPAPSPSPTPSPEPNNNAMGFCGVASTIPDKNEATWGPLFASANINWFWNWDTKVDSTQYVPEGWYFVPNVWGSGGFPVSIGTTAHDGPGADSYEIVDILLGWNEPDIVGLCISQPEVQSPADGWCQTAGSMGWWFPDLISNPTCMMGDWYTQVDDAVSKGYRVASPMVAVGTGETWLKPFVDASCSAGRCPKFLAWHFYSMGCYDDDAHLAGFEQKLDDSLALMQQYPTIEGVLITEAGTLALEDDGSEAAPTCSDDVLVTVMRKMFSIMRQSKYYINGKHIVSHFSWFSQDGTGATYSLSLVDPDTGAVRPLGQAYAEECAQMSTTSVVV